MTTKAKVGRKPKQALTIAIDCGALSPKDEREKLGVARVVENLLLELAKIDKRNQYLLYSFAPLPKNLVSNFGERVKAQVLPSFGYLRLWMRLALILDTPDVFIATSQAMPTTQVPTLGFIYDAAFNTYSELYTNAERLKRNTSELINRARHIITISQASKEEIAETFKLDERIISVYHPAANKIFNPVGSKYIDTLPYFLYVGALKLTKNISKLVAAFTRFNQKHALSYKLVLVGSDKGVSKDFLRDIEEKYKTQVVVKGYVNNNDLPKYYRGAYAFISPAISEGFGLPTLEAMACGTAVIVGENPASREIVAKAGLIVAPENMSEIEQAMSKLTEQKQLRQKLITMGLRRARAFSWPRCARGVLQAVYKYCR